MTCAPDHRRFNWVWYRPLPVSRLQDMLRGDDGVQYEVSIPPPQVRQDLIDELRQAGDGIPAASLQRHSCLHQAAVLHPDLRLHHAADGVRTGRLDRRCGRARRPHIGMGVSKAASDALVLSECLADPATFRSPRSPSPGSTTIRLPVGEKTVRRRPGSRRLHAAAPARCRRGYANWEEFHSIRGILTHTASSAFLRVEPHSPDLP